MVKLASVHQSNTQIQVLQPYGLMKRFAELFTFLKKMKRFGAEKKLQITAHCKFTTFQVPAMESLLHRLSGSKAKVTESDLFYQKGLMAKLNQSGTSGGTKQLKVFYF
jgi:hypothetical protein